MVLRHEDLVKAQQTDLDRLYEDYRLQDGQQEGCEPVDWLGVSPLHAVEHREEARQSDAQEHHWRKQ